MKYPQAYLVIHKDFVMPPLATLKAWAQPCQDIYFPGVSDPIDELDQHIFGIRDLHRYIAGHAAEGSQMIVLQYEEIPDFLYMSLIPNVVEIYWLFDLTIAEKLKKIKYAVQAARNFKRSVIEASADYFDLVELLTDVTGDRPFFNAAIDKFFTARGLGDRSFEGLIFNQIAKSLTRTDNRRGIDLK